jgi:hypothetical protein
MGKGDANMRLKLRKGGKKFQKVITITVNGSGEKVAKKWINQPQANSVTEAHRILSDRRRQIQL